MRVTTSPPEAGTIHGCGRSASGVAGITPPVTSTCTYDCRALRGERLALLFRDWLRANPRAVVAYSLFKRVLASSSPDLDSYTDVKDPVVDLVVLAAEPWATTTKWQPQHATRNR